MLLNKLLLRCNFRKCFWFLNIFSGIIDIWQFFMCLQRYQSKLHIILHAKRTYKFWVKFRPSNEFTVNRNRFPIKKKLVTCGVVFGIVVKFKKTQNRAVDLHKHFGGMNFASSSEIDWYKMKICITICDFRRDSHRFEDGIWKQEKKLKPPSWLILIKPNAAKKNAKKVRHRRQK